MAVGRLLAVRWSLAICGLPGGLLSLLPDIENCFDAKAGVCQDLSAIMVCMLRVQGIPAKLMIGYADSYYHAWIVAVVNGKETFFDPTHAIGCINAKKYAVERFY